MAILARSCYTRVILGVHSGGGNGYNVGARITAGKYDTICKSIEQDHPGHCDAKRYSVVETVHGKCLDVHVGELFTNGGTVRVWDCNNAIQQLWYYDTSTNEIKNKAL
eukprot:515665_1